MKHDNVFFRTLYDGTFLKNKRGMDGLSLSPKTLIYFLLALFLFFTLSVILAAMTGVLGVR